MQDSGFETLPTNLPRNWACLRRPRSRAQAAVISTVGLVRAAVPLRLEPVENRPDDRRTNRLQLLPGAPHLVEVRAAGADYQQNRIDDAGKEQGIIGGENGR